MSNKTKKQLLLNLPYFIAGLVCTNLGEAWRIAEGADMSEKLLGFLSALGAAFSNPMPSLHPMDLLIGVCCGAGLRLAVYLKGKNAKKYRHGIDDYEIGGNQMKENWVYRRGDIYLANLGVPIGSKQGGVRPVVVLQNDVGNFYSPTITVAPLTTKIQKKRSQPTHYFLRKAKGLARSSMVLAEQLDTCDKTCVIRYLGKVSKGQMRGIDEAVKVQLGYYIPEQAEKRRQGKCRKEVNFDGG